MDPLAYCDEIGYSRFMSKLTALIKYRQDTGKTQQDLANECRVPRETVARWELGLRKISASRKDGPSKLDVVSEKTGIPKPELRPDLAELLGAQ